MKRAVILAVSLFFALTVSPHSVYTAGPSAILNAGGRVPDPVNVGETLHFALTFVDRGDDDAINGHLQIGTIGCPVVDADIWCNEDDPTPFTATARIDACFDPSDQVIEATVKVNWVIPNERTITVTEVTPGGDVITTYYLDEDARLSCRNPGQ